MKSHTKVLKQLAQFQENDRESREQARESMTFTHKKGGQWEERVRKVFTGKPRYEFDRVFPVIKSICGDIEETEFSARVVEAGGGADSETAETYDGMLRAIQNMSNFLAIRKAATKHLVTTGFDAWMCVTDWADVDAFEQDILIKSIPDALNRVWLGPCDEIDGSDRREAFVLTGIPVEQYAEEYPDGARQSVGSDAEICETDDKVVIGDYYYIKDEKVTLHLLSNDKVVRADQFDAVAGEMAAQGVTVVRSRERNLPMCYCRKFDGGGWLGESQPTPFAYIPVVGVFAHYEVIEGRVLYSGVTEKLKDPQRVYNYAKSREISEGALAPIEKIAITEKQAAGHEAQNSTLNSDSNPLFVYNADGQAPPPFKLPGTQPNANLSITQQGAAVDIQEISNSFNPARGQALSNHSGVAYELLQSKSNLSSKDYVSALCLAVELTCKIIVDAIPKVYDTRGRQVRLVNEDGTGQFTTLNDEVMSADGQMVTLRDLSQGHYTVSITTGPSFASKKTEGVEAMLSIAQAYPAILEEGADVFVKSMDAPYIDQIGDRIRARMIKEGRIPENQLTDEERQKIMEEMERQAQQPPDPMQTATLEAILADVERMKADVLEKFQDMQLQLREQERKDAELALKAATTAVEIQNKQADTVEKLTKSEQENKMPGNAGNKAATKVAKEID